jgi:hypothetical protein
MGPEVFDAITMLNEVDERVEALALEGVGGVAVTEFVTLRLAALELQQAS